MQSTSREVAALKADSFGRIALMRDDAGLFVRRDLVHVPLWLRLPAWWLARRIPVFARDSRCSAAVAASTFAGRSSVRYASR